jgi:endonuclease G, mitochondrial
MGTKNHIQDFVRSALLVSCMLIFLKGNAQELLPHSAYPIIAHSAYSLGYSETHEQAAWVYYLLTKEETKALYERTDRFVEDPLVATGSASNADYAGSGYDRGHLAPAADMAWSAESMAESFYFSNMSPQDPSFNRGIWKKLEEQVRNWAVYYDSIYVVTGAVLQDSLPSIGVNHVAVPRYYYKVLLDLDYSHFQSIGFLLPNQKSSEALTHFIVSVDSIEQLTGIDFYADLNDSLENTFESRSEPDQWNWDVASLRPASTKINTETTQCLGNTKAGARCQNNTSNSNGYCHLHQSQYVAQPQLLDEAVQCTGITQKGMRCTRMTKNATHRCYQH